MLNRKHWRFDASEISDFGGVIKGRADKIFIASNLDEARACLSFARDRDFDVTVRSLRGGHSMMGQSVPDGGCLLLLNINDDISWINKDTIEVPSSCSLKSINEFLRDRNMQLSVCPDHFDLTIGGVVSVGGFSPESFTKGALVESVVELTMLDHSGDLIRCSKSENSKRFYGVLCGLGSQGIIWSVRLKSEKIYPLVHQSFKINFSPRKYQNLIKELSKMNESELPLSVRFLIGANMGPIKYSGPLLEVSSLDSPENISKIIGGFDASFENNNIRDSWSQVANSWALPESDRFEYRIWSDNFVAVRDVSKYINKMDKMIKSWKIDYDVVLHSVPCKTSSDGVNFPHSIDGRFAVSVGAYANIRSNYNLAKKVSKDQKRLSDFAISLGGKPYRYGWH